MIDHFYQSIPVRSPGVTQVYQLTVSEAQSDTESALVYVEVGSQPGHSTAFMAVEIANSGKNIEFTTIDLLAQPLEAADGLYTLKNTDSIQAADDYENASLDFVFLDPDDVSGLVDHIRVWLPKVKTGGTLGGSNYYWKNSGPVETAVHQFFKQEAVSNPAGCWVVTVEPAGPQS